MPDESTILRFRHRLEKHKLAEQILATVNDLLAAQGQSALMRLSPAMLTKHRDRCGSVLETWVYGELRKNLALSDECWFLGHYRDKDQVEVDFVLKSPLREVIGLEVKAAATVAAADFRGLRRLKEHTGNDFLTGIVFYDGDKSLPFGDGLSAVPLAAL